ncbi:uncharacterized protein LOC124454175 [Xenia sp. Carnegie-2017]|uniref:uncharacterized protein LOC124454175 n=1 Tax=Xenia sp. Carnegie-2017 TaxID=2897299 RepID=UPI001F041861|nr:uncharacterized protein LOC124454175 [Xenia sp. Carnegie-2017]
MAEYNSLFLQLLVLVLLLFLAHKFLKSISSRGNAVCNGNNRRLNFLERYYVSASTLNEGYANISCVVLLSSKKSLLFKDVYDSLVLLVKRQPMLRCVISTKKDGELYYEIKNIEDAIPLFDIKKSDDKISEWKELIYKYTSTVHKNDLSWKAVILQQEYNTTTQVYTNMIMFAFKHSCIDGISTVKFVEQFINSLNEITDGISYDEKEISSLKLLPSAHSLITQDNVGHTLFRFITNCFGVRPILTFLFEQMVLYKLKKKALNPFYQKYPPLSLDTVLPESVERLEIKTFNEEETKTIVEACKANGCTVTGAITAATNLAFYQLLDEKDKKMLNLETTFACNNRSYGNKKPQNDYLGLFIYVFSYHMNYSQPDLHKFWTMAKENTIKLKQLVKIKAFVKEFTLMSCSGFHPNTLVNLRLKDDSIWKSTSNAISNYGVFHIESSRGPSTNFKIENCYIHGIYHKADFLLRHNICTVNGKLTWMIRSDATISDDHAQQMSHLCFNELSKNCCLMAKV